jgi:hypothetical protein
MAAKSAKPTQVYIMNAQKGGAGKTALCLLLLHHLNVAGRPVKLIEFDKANPDTWMAADFLTDGETKFQLDIDKQLAWEHAEQIIMDAAGHSIIVNLPAQCEVAVESHLVPLLKEDHETRYRTIWSLGPFHDCILLLEKYLAFQTPEPVYVVRSMFQVDDESDFEPFDKARQNMDLRGGEVVDHVESPFRTRRLIFEGAMQADGSFARQSFDTILKNSTHLIRGRTKDFLRKMAPTLDAITRQ